ncbi:hypothetical protein Bca4012_033724 [Brassica carinata]
MKLVEEQRRSFSRVVKLSVSAMKTRRRNLSGDRLTTTTRRNTRSKTLEDGRDNSLPFPIDVIMEIFSRLPVKSIAICRCVSKTWSSVLRRKDFTELFLSRSRTLPKLLLAYKKGGELFFFSAPQPQNPDASSSPVVATYHMKLSFDAYFRRNSGFQISGLDQGLVGLTDQWFLRGSKYSAPVICNPSTGQLFGYDPIDKQVKVLSLSGEPNMVSEEYQIMTLGMGKLFQRMINCGRFLLCNPHFKGICINGVLYYPSVDFPRGSYLLVCFDVRSEKLTFINDDNFIIMVGTMINYNGKLGFLLSVKSDYVDESSTSVNLWVLEDIEKQEWSEHIYVLPHLWKDIVGRASLSFVGMTRANEIVMQPLAYPPTPLYLIYFNIERNTVVRVAIQGMDGSGCAHVKIFLDHVENVKLL